MNELPRGWAETTLGVVGEYLNGRGFRKAEWCESGRPIIRIQNLTGTSSDFNYYDGSAEESYIARRGDLLVSWAATLGVFIWPGPEAVVNQHIFKVESHIDRGFHRYLIASVLDDLQRQTHGSGMVHITRSKFDSTAVALPPLAEQRRIVAAIEEHFSRLAAAEESLRRARRRVQLFRSAVLEAAATGHLGVDSNHASSEWTKVSIGELAADTLIGLDRSRSHQSRDPSTGYPYVRMNNITTEGDIVWDDLTFVAVSDSERQRFSVSDGDLLFNTRNSRELVGKVGLARRPPENAVYNNNLMRIRLDECVEPAFVWIVMCSPSFRGVLDSVKNATTNVAAIYAKNLLPLKVPVPPLADQRRIVAEVERRLSLVDALAAATTAALKRSAALRRSILERAFTGQLVPQDPTDESASALLDRIRAEREARV